MDHVILPRCLVSIISRLCWNWLILLRFLTKRWQTLYPVNNRVRFLFLARSKLRLCSANHRAGYWSNLPCDWSSTAWAYSEQEIENGPWSFFLQNGCLLHLVALTHWGRVTHICISKLTIIGSHNGLSPGRREAIIWTSVGILLIRPLGANFSEILIEIYTFSFRKMHLKMSSGKWQPFCLGLNVDRMANPELWRLPWIYPWVPLNVNILGNMIALLILALYSMLV